MRFGVFLLTALASQVASQAVFNVFILRCNKQGDAAQAGVDAQKARAEAAIAQKMQQASIIMTGVMSIKGSLASLVVLKNSIGVNQTNRAAVINKINAVMANLRSQLNSKVAACKAYSNQAADMRRQTKLHIVAIITKWEGWVERVEDALNALEQRFKGHAAWSVLHKSVQLTIDAFEACVDPFNVNLAAVQKAYSTDIGGEADEYMKCVEAAAGCDDETQQCNNDCN